MRENVGACALTFYLFTTLNYMEVAIISKYINTKSDELVNENIRFKEVLVINQDGTQLGVKSRNDALRIAREANLDLVCVAANAKTPVCRIMNYGKYRFEQQKKAKEMKKNQKTFTVKEIQLSPTIDTHDVNTKLKHALKWLESGDKVKVGVNFRGRQMAHIDIGEKILKEFLDQCAEVCVIEKPAKLEGRNLYAIIAPKKK
jgi:translation initiation factor IF-3